MGRTQEHRSFKFSRLCGSFFMESASYSLLSFVATVVVAQHWQVQPNVLSVLWKDTLLCVGGK